METPNRTKCPLCEGYRTRKEREGYIYCKDCNSIVEVKEPRCSIIKKDGATCLNPAFRDGGDTFVKNVMYLCQDHYRMWNEGKIL